MPLLTIASRGLRRPSYIPAAPTLTSFVVEAAAGGSIGAQVTGVAFDIKITAKDQFGATFTSFTGTATVTSSGTLSSGSGTTAAFTAGVLASHSVAFSAIGTGVTITATNGGAAGISNGFNVTADSWTIVKERYFTTVSPPSGWYNSDPTANLQLNGDSTALRMIYHNTPGGSSPNVTGTTDFTAAPIIRIRQTLLLSSSPAFDLHNPTNKVSFAYLGSVAPNKVFITFEGSGGTGGTVNVCVQTQGTVSHGGGTVFTTTLNILRGASHTYDLIIARNSSGTADGYIQLWVDGIQYTLTSGAGSPTAVQWTSTAQLWNEVNWFPVWGGGGGNTGSADFYMETSYMSVSVPT